MTTAPAMTASRDAIVVSGLSVDRQKAHALQDLSFVLPPGHVVGLLGPSGSGKTTLMRCLLGLQANVTGSVMVLGRDATDPELRRHRGYASQSASVYDDLTVTENLRYFSSLLGATRSEISRVLQLVDLEDCAHRKTGKLSGGERSRASLAVALLGQPDLLILDEPTVGLDPVLREQLWTLFHRLSDGGASLVISSHVMNEAERCDSLLLLRDGRLIAQGTSHELRARTGTTSMDEAFLRLVGGA